MIGGPTVAVVGSANLDVVVRARVHPEPGETVMGISYDETVGGKGANQAMAVAEHCAVEFVGCVGTDEAGDRILDRLSQWRVGTDRVSRVPGPSGSAFITVARDGENSIVVVPLANNGVTSAQVEDALDRIVPVAVLAQLEIPVEAVDAARRWSERRDVRFILNPSPVRQVTAGLLAPCDPLIVNVVEARTLLGSASSGVEELALGLSRVARSAVVTLGAEGALIARGGAVTHIPAPRVEVRDTTGAGDSFAGTVVARLGMGDDLLHAVRAGVDRASDLVARHRAER